MDGNEFEIEKLKIKFNFIKFIISVILVSSVTTILNYNLKQKAIRIKEIEITENLEMKRLELNKSLEMKQAEIANVHLSRFIKEVTDKDPDKRMKIAKYFSVLSVTEDVRKRWENYIEIIADDIKQIKEKRNQVSDLFILKNEIIKIMSEALKNQNISKIEEKTLEIEKVNNKIELLTNQIDALKGEAVKGHESIPSWLKLAYNEIGIKEYDGNGDNPEVVKYLKSVDMLSVNSQNNDETPWSGAFVNWCLEQVGIKGINKANNHSWMQWGIKLNKAKKGCIVILWKGDLSGGEKHFGFFIKETASYIYLLGGNQNDQVKIEKFPKNRVLGYLWPIEEH